jgi:hypothetical protein
MNQISKFLFCLCCLIASFQISSSQLDVVVAGNGGSGFNGDGFPATSTNFSSVFGVWGDTGGNIYLSDQNNNRIRKIGPNGIVTTVAGSGGFATVGGSGWATSIPIGYPWGIVGFGDMIYFSDEYFVWELEMNSGTMCNITDSDVLNNPTGVAVSNTGIIYVADYSHRVHQITGGNVTVFAGSGTASFCGDGGQATEACFYNPYGMWVNTNGVVFIADYSNDRVRYVTTDGFIYTFAGGGSGADGVVGFASEVSLSQPYDVKGDLVGNICIAEVGYNRIRMVDTNNIITTLCSTPSSSYGIWVDAVGGVYFTQYYYLYKVGASSAPTVEPTLSPTLIGTGVIAGSGNSGFNGDGLAAISTSFNSLYGIWGDDEGSIYLADQSNNRIRKMDTNGIVTTVAGSSGSSSAGGSGGSGPATALQIGYPWGIVGYQGLLYFTDEYFLWQLDLNSETMSSLTDPGALNIPTGVAVSSTGIVYVADYSHRIQQISDGIMTLFAGTGSAGYCGDNGPATEACLCYPYGLWVDTTAVVFIADSSNARVRYVTSDGFIYTFAGGGNGGDGGLASEAYLSSPYDVKGDSLGNVFITEAGYNRIRMVDTNNIITTLCSTPSSSYGIWIDANDGVYFTQYYYVYKVGASSAPTFEPTLAPTLANTVVVVGNGNSDFNGDGFAGTSTSFNDLFGVWGDNEGNVYLADQSNYRIRKKDTNGIVTTVAGSGGSSNAGGFGPATSIPIGYPWGIVGYGNMIYFSDEYFVWELDLSSGMMSNITDSDVLNNPTGVAVSSTGIIYVADYSHRVGRIADGSITVFAGSGIPSYCGDEGPATEACLYYPYGLWVNTNGVLFIADYSNSRVRYVTTEGFIFTFAGGGNGGDGGLASEAYLSNPSDVKGDLVGNVFIVEYNNYRIRVVNTNNIITTICSTPSQSYGIWVDAADGVFFTQPNYLYKTSSTMAPTVEPTPSPTHSLSVVAAGNGNSGFSGDGFAATSTSFNYLFGVWGDTIGNIFLSDQNNYRIRKIDPNGFVTTVAGSGSWSNVGGSGPAISTPIGYPWGIAGYENLIYFSDQYFVWKLDLSSGIMSTVAGNGGNSFDGDNGPSTTAALSNPTGVAVSSTGIIFVADYSNHRIRKIENEIITTFAGSGSLGYCGDNGPATDACLYYPTGLWVDTNGVVFIADYDGNRVRQVSTDGFIYTFAGGGSGGDGGLATEAFLSQPYDVNGDLFGNIYISEVGDYRIRMVDTNNIITTYCSTPSSSYGIWIDAASEVYFTQPWYLYKAGGTMAPTILPTPSPTHSLSVVAAGNGDSGFNGDGYPATSTSFNSLFGVWGDDEGNIYLSDQSNYRIRKIGINGIVTTVAGSGGYSTAGGSGPATSIHLGLPWGMAGYENFLYFSDQYYVWELNLSSGMMSTIAGNGGFSYGGDDGPATSGILNNPMGIALSNTGIVYIADYSNHRIRKIENGIITTFAGSGNTYYCGDGDLATNACLYYPIGVWVDSNGVVFIADNSNARVRYVTTEGFIYTFAGGGSRVDGGSASEAFLSSPYDVKGDLFGNIFISEVGYNRIRMVDANNIITTYCSTPSNSYGIWIDANDEVYFTQYYYLYKAGGTMTPTIEPTPSPTHSLSVMVAGNGGYGFNGDGFAATSTSFNYLYGVWGDTIGNIYLSK